MIIIIRASLVGRRALLYARNLFGNLLRRVKVLKSIIAVRT